MSPSVTSDRNPAAVTLTRSGGGTGPGPAGISNRPFDVEMLLTSLQDGELTAMRAAMSPGTVTHWHSHPRGQLLYALTGIGNAQAEGRDILELRPGDSIWFPADLRHWHGAAPNVPFSYISVQGVEAGTAVTWFEPVSGREIPT